MMIRITTAQRLPRLDGNARPVFYGRCIAGGRGKQLKQSVLFTAPKLL